MKKRTQRTCAGLPRAARGNLAQEEKAKKGTQRYELQVTYDRNW